MGTSHASKPAAARQSGAISIMFVLLLLPTVGLCALALDLAMVYNRQAEMHSLAKAVAISAARRLNGTTSGIDNALVDAALTAGSTRYQNYKETITWSADAIKFSTSADRNGPWMDAGVATSQAAKIFYVKVNTLGMTGMGTVNTVLARALSERFATVTTGSEAIAGRTDIAVAPLAICAMGQRASQRTNPGNNIELVEYGFRRGVSYDLMKLNPNGTTPLSFLINPLATPGSAGSASGFSVATVGPYACSGTLGIPGVSGAAISVQSPFPLPALYRLLNSRFDDYTDSSCTVNGAPPDTNIRAYVYTEVVTKLAWMNTQPDVQSAASSTGANRLETIADIAPAGGSAVKYGPLWAASKAVAYSSYTASPIEPAGGYTPMPTTVWPSLYGGQTAKTSYPVSTPYRAGVSENLVKPSADHGPGVKNRRILNVPLLDCSTSPSSSATVLGVGKFFMTVPATTTVLAAEFVGTIPTDRIPGNTGLFQ